MALEDIVKNGATTSIAIGVTAAAATLILAPVVIKMGRPFARAAVKTGIVFYEKARETAAEIGEVMEDLVAEARAELDKGSEPLSSEPAAESQKSAGREVEMKIE
jgi:hypothetical protein